MKIPTLENYQNYTGHHCHKIWAEVGPYFICPGCGRNKFQLLRWTIRNPGKPSSFKDWVAILHRHHDHSGDLFNPSTGRFPVTIVCGQCNASDGSVKRRLKLPRNFSFSAYEISHFIQATPHAAHKIDFEVARRIYNDLTGTLNC